MVPIEITLSSELITTCGLLLVSAIMVVVLVMYYKFDPIGTTLFVESMALSLCVVVVAILLGIIPENEYIPNVIKWSIVDGAP